MGGSRVTKALLGRSSVVTRRCLTTLVALLSMGALLLAAPAFSALPDKPKSGWAHDCTSGARLDRAHPHRVDYLIWCGTEIGRFAFSVHPAKGSRILGFAPILTPAGAGAFAPFRCRRHGEALRCEGRKRGPIVLRGWVALPPRTRCTELLTFRLPFEIYHGAPDGCSPHRWQPKFGFGYMKSFRHEFGLDPDLAGDAAAITQRIRGLVVAWRHGNPVARWTMQNLGLPLRPRDQRELDYRDTYIGHNAAALQRWVPGHAASTYAGYDVDHEHGGIFYIGFVGDQQAQIEAFEREAGAIAPDRIRPFPVQPTHSEGELGALEEKLSKDESLWTLINSLSIDTLANKVEVGTLHVVKVRQFLDERYGSDAPIEVVHAEPPVPLAFGRSS
jgi:hypothetical protein